MDRAEVPDYYDIIRDPMDFGTVKRKLEVRLDIPHTQTTKFAMAKKIAIEYFKEPAFKCRRIKYLIRCRIVSNVINCVIFQTGIKTGKTLYTSILKL